MARIWRTFVAILTVALLASVLTAAPAHAMEAEASDLVVRLRGDIGEEVAGIYLNGEHHADLLCLLYTSPSPRDRQKSRMPSSA